MKSSTKRPLARHLVGLFSFTSLVFNSLPINQPLKSLPLSTAVWQLIFSWRCVRLLSFTPFFVFARCIKYKQLEYQNWIINSLKRTHYFLHLLKREVLLLQLWIKFHFRFSTCQTNQESFFPGMQLLWGTFHKVMEKFRPVRYWTGSYLVPGKDLFAAWPLTKLCFSEESICNVDILQSSFYYPD